MSACGSGLSIQPYGETDAVNGASLTWALYTINHLFR
jgi:hypothetical protein